MTIQQEIENAKLTGIRDDLKAVAHKLRYPMAAILAMVPGETLAARARACGVSRQTMYVWAQERFRPTGEQAEIIANLTGVPTPHILANGYEDDNVSSGKPARKKTSRLAKAGKKLPRRTIRLRAKSGGMVAEQGKRRYDRTAGKRTRRRPSGGQSD